MSTNQEKKLDDLTGRTVVVFEKWEDARAAASALILSGFDEDQVDLLHGRGDADRIDDSFKLLADTDEEISWYTKDLREGRTLVAVIARDEQTRNIVQDVCGRYGGAHMTHFGHWMTKTETLQDDHTNDNAQA